MLPFTVELRPNEPVVEQVVYAVTRAIVSGQLRPGERFPSVRALSHELRINPNTAQKIVATLAGRQLLDVRQGASTIVAPQFEGDHRQRTELDAQYAEPMVVEARRLGLTLQELLEIVRDRWRQVNESR
jgi:GntR family transcriptional regulator